MVDLAKEFKVQCYQYLTWNVKKDWRSHNPCCIIKKKFSPGCKRRNKGVFYFGLVSIRMLLKLLFHIMTPWNNDIKRYDVRQIFCLLLWCDSPIRSSVWLTIFKRETHNGKEAMHIKKQIRTFTRFYCPSKTALGFLDL